jgi:serine/threonine-protein kinase
VNPERPTPDESLLREWRVEYELRRDRGEAVSPEQLVPPEHQRLLPEFLRLIQQHQRLIGMAGTDGGAMTPSADETVVPNRGGLEGVAGLTPISHYVDLKKHAQGGLGEVFRAQDRALQREVAIKVIKAEQAGSPDAVRRFRIEAEVTGRLVHPGIVPVHGLGRSEDGRPCYIMRFIDGDTLRTAIRRLHHNFAKRQNRLFTSLEFRELLGRFVTVCNTIAYANSRGILHRDIKPENIMLGPYGETLVVDWGLAKAIERDDDSRATSTEASLLPKAAGPNPRAATLGGIGTLAYMSPEQAVGLTSALRSTSDVYSLGATLYVLLTARSPVTGTDQGEMLQRIHDGMITPPREVNRRVPRALDAICRKAMAPRAKYRYPTAQALAEDIQNWLGDGPVSAHKDTIAAVGRWARRHKPLVTGAAALLVTAVVALTISTALIYREKAHTDEQRRLAVANFDLADKAIDDLLTEVGETDLAHEPRMEAVREKLLLKAKEYRDKLLAQDVSDPALREKAALARKRVADIWRHLGRFQDSAAEYETAISLFADLTRANQPLLRLRMAECCIFLGEVYWELQDMAKAEATYRRGRSLSQELLGDFTNNSPQQREYRKELGRSYYNLGIAFEHLDKFDDAAKEHQQAIAIFRELLALDATNPSYRKHLARGYLNLGPVLHQKPAESERVLQEAVHIYTELHKQDVHNSDLRHELALAHNNLGHLHVDRGRLDDALHDFNQARENFEVLVKDFPRTPKHSEELARTFINLGLVHARQGKDDLAEEAWKQAREHSKRLIKNKDKPGYHFLLATSLLDLGWLLLDKQARLGDASEYLKLADDALQKALRPNGNNPKYRESLRHLLAYQAEIWLQQGDIPNTVKAAKKLATVFPDRASDAWLAARFLARCAALTPGAPSESLAQQALDLLTQARGRSLQAISANDIVQGLQRRDAFIRDALVQKLPDAQWLEQDPAFAAIRDRAEFQALLAQVKAAAKEVR